MKKLLTFFMCVLTPYLLSAQDYIVKYNGDIIECEITSVTNQTVSFKYPKENIENTISLSNIKVVELSSGRKIQGIPRVYVRGEFDWESVNIVNDDSYSEGLEFVDEIRETSTDVMLGQFGSSGKQQLEVLEEVQKTAAKYGCHLIVIVNGISGSSGVKSWASASLVAKAYRYKDVPEVYPMRIIAKQQDLKDLFCNEYLFKSMLPSYQYEFLRDFCRTMKHAIKECDSIEVLDSLKFSSQVAAIMEYVDGGELSIDHKDVVVRECNNLVKIYNSKLDKLNKKNH